MLEQVPKRFGCCSNAEPDFKVDFLGKEEEKIRCRGSKPGTSLHHLGHHPYQSHREVDEVFQAIIGFLSVGHYLAFYASSCSLKQSLLGNSAAELKQLNEIKLKIEPSQQIE